MEDQALIPTQIAVDVRRTSLYRWVVLTVFSIFSLLQSAVWDTWGPISPSATRAIGFSEHDYYLLSNWAPIGIMPTMPIFIWLFNNYGTRIPVVIGSFLVASGTGLRCIPVTGQSRIIAIHIGQFLSSVAGCVVLGAGPLISNTWFPSNERILATSVMICVGNIGNALSYLIGPSIVSGPANCSNNHNATTPTANIPKLDQGSVFNVSPTTEESTTPCYDNTDEIREQINYYLYGEFALGVALLLSTIFLYRNKPAVPPSSSAAERRFYFRDGLHQLSRNIFFWMSAIAFALVNGAYYGWYGIVTVLVTPYHISEADVSRAASVMTVVGSSLGITVGWFSDRLKGRIKWILFTCYCMMFVSFLLLSFIVMGWFNIFKFSRGGFLTCFVILGSFSNIIQPLGMELAADIAYPVNEGVSTSVVAWLIMFFMFIFLLILNSLPVEDQDVANYLFLAFVGVAAPILALSTKNESVRITIDRLQINDDVASENETESDSSESQAHRKKKCET